MKITEEIPQQNHNGVLSESHQVIWNSPISCTLAFQREKQNTLMQIKAHLSNMSLNDPSSKYLSGCLRNRKYENNKWMPTATKTKCWKLEANRTKASILETSINKRQEKWKTEAKLKTSNNWLCSLPRRRSLQKLNKLKANRAKDLMTFIATNKSANEVQSMVPFWKRRYSWRAT